MLCWEFILLGLVSNLISEAALAVEMGARLEDMALTIHPHPTLGETMMEAAEAALGHAIPYHSTTFKNKTRVDMENFISTTILLNLRIHEVKSVTSNISSTLEILDWGLIDYSQTLQRQMELVEQVAIEG